MNAQPLTIISLDITNFARIRAVHIEPDPTGAIVIGGRNAQGKSSVLNAIAQVIDSSKYKVPVPVHLGADSANIVAVLGRNGEPELVVRWKMDQSGRKSFVVEDADGVKKSSPAAMIKSLFGLLAVNPFAFATAKPDDQLKILLGTTGFDVDEWKEARKDIFSKRTIMNRELDKRKKVVSSLPKPLDTQSREPVSTSDLLERRRRAREVADQYRANGEMVNTWGDEVTRLTALLEDAKKNLQQAIRYSEAFNTEENRNLAASEESLTAQLENIDATNSAAEAARRYDEAVVELGSYQGQVDSLTEQLENHDRLLRDTISNIDIPIRGLAYEEDELRLNGVNFAAASHAEKITISTALAIASQPEAGVILVEDASLMDGYTTKIVTQMAENHNMQVWLEVVGEEDGIIIEDGEVLA